MGGNVEVMDKMQKRMIYIAVLIFSLYLVVFGVFSSNKEAVTRLSQNRYQLYQRSHNGSMDKEQRVYEAKYVCYKNGQKQTIVARVYPQNSNLPENYYGTVKERAAKQIKDAANSRNIPLEQGYEEKILIEPVYNTK
jgi:hypothetical protein